MKTLYRAWLWALLVLPVAVPSVAAPGAVGDIVAVDSAAPLDDPGTVPGLLTGQRLMDALHVALGLLRGGVAEAARPGLERIDGELQRLVAGDDLASPLPAGYRVGGQLWLPVRAETLRVWLDAPDLLPRPVRGGAPADRLPARARRITWLAVTDSGRRVRAALARLGAGESGRAYARRQLETVVSGVRTTLALSDPALLRVYYSVEAALAAGPHWDRAMRRDLRHGADTLAQNAGSADLAGRIREQAGRLTPDPRGLRELASAMRRRLAADAGAVAR